MNWFEQYNGVREKVYTVIKDEASRHTPGQSIKLSYPFADVTITFK